MQVRTVAFYKPLYDYIKNKGGKAEVVLNPGTNTSECYISVADIIVNYDDTYSNYVNWSPLSWMYNYSVNHFWQIISNTSQANLHSAVSLSKSRNAGWIYFTDHSGDNPFESLPSYWNDELSLANGS